MKIILKKVKTLNYIWMNPVVEKMYEKDLDCLKDNLNKKGFHVVSAEGQLTKVKDKFKTEIINSKKTVLDTRCPVAIDYAIKDINIDKYNIPNIEPILIHTARYLYDFYIKDTKKDKLIITTPCKALKELGEKIFKDKPGIEFCTWLEICKKLNIEVASRCSLSPIPLGFFRDISDNVLEISGENKFNESFLNEEYDVIEMLYCLGGCNNGDGV